MVMLAARAFVLSVEGVTKDKTVTEQLSRLVITHQTPLVFLLPTDSHEGVCATSVVEYLYDRAHNEFIRRCRRLNKLFEYDNVDIIPGWNLLSQRFFLQQSTRC